MAVMRLHAAQLGRNRLSRFEHGFSRGRANFREEGVHVDSDQLGPVGLAVEPFAGVGFTDRSAAGAIAGKGPNTSHHRVRTIYLDILDAPTAARRARSGEISPSLQEASKIGNRQRA